MATTVAPSRSHHGARSSWLGAMLATMMAMVMLLSTPGAAYQVVISSDDSVRQVCNGMFAGTADHPAYIEVIFKPSSKGQLALVVYEWKDAAHLGVDRHKPNSDTTSDTAQGEGEAWSADRVYICTLSAVQAKLCAEADLGTFITTPASLASTDANATILTTSVRFDHPNTEDDPWTLNRYRYEVLKTGYYCVGSVPVALEQSASNSSYIGVVDFENTFGGNLPASEYPKVFVSTEWLHYLLSSPSPLLIKNFPPQQFYFVLSMIYLGLAAVWLVLCYQHRRDLLPIQNYITATILFLVVEMFAVWRYFAYVNDKGHPGVTVAYLIFITALNAFRNSVSFFILLIVSMGYSIVRPSLGSTMMRVRLLAMIHFVFGSLYSIGTASFLFDNPGQSYGIDLWQILFCVIPLSLSLTTFLMWILWSLNTTISDLQSRRQSFKTSMFVKLYRILMFSVIIIFVFFVISALSFSYRLNDDFAPDTWRYQWILVDGWLSILYMVVFFSVAWIWRPSSRNRRLGLSDEVPTDDLDAEHYDVDAISTGDRDGDDDDDDDEHVALKGMGSNADDGKVVFDVGSDEDEEEAIGGRRRSERRSGEEARLNGREDDSDGEGDISGNRHERVSSSGSSQRSGPPKYSRRD
ncbi:BQ2448_3724 [Microbotryum intermedium]|uniref:BQ2448_3724 protein n=1 Tax=Microbotryum intermedium TaxID=269621 RepID=A0A238FAU2_9BASI|nr:BQ2448_3724 [Microbotryum intermedium]